MVMVVELDVPTKDIVLVSDPRPTEGLLQLARYFA
jgi:hypothetical protein